MKKKHCWKNPSQNQHDMLQSGLFIAQWQNARLNKQAVNKEAGFDVERDKMQSLDTNIVNMMASLREVCKGGWGTVSAQKFVYL